MSVQQSESSFFEDICFGLYPTTSKSLLLSKTATNIHTISCRVYNCSDCEYTTTRKGDLVKHERIHTGTKPFHCNYCNREFTQSSHLAVHKKLHE